MSAVTPLCEATILQQLEILPHWSLTEHAIERVISCQTYLQALDLLHNIGQLAEGMNHHPDMMLAYKQLTIRFWTHSADGITQHDIAAAHRVEDLLAKSL